MVIGRCGLFQEIHSPQITLDLQISLEKLTRPLVLRLDEARKINTRVRFRAADPRGFEVGLGCIVRPPVQETVNESFLVAWLGRGARDSPAIQFELRALGRKSRTL